MKRAIKSLISNIKNNYKKLRSNPREFWHDSKKAIKECAHNNKMFMIFVFLNVLNAFLLRWFTQSDINVALDFRTVLADTAFVVIVGSFSYFMKGKSKTTYLFIWTLIMTTLCVINSAYYTFYTSYTSISLLSTAKFITAVGDAVVENVL